MGPVRPVDDAAIFTTITTTQPPKWRFESMFSAIKFVVAGAIVALFGGFLLISLPLEHHEVIVPGAATDAPGTFSPAGTLGLARHSHSATLLPDGRVLVVGGASGDSTEVDPATVRASAEIWDPDTTSFEPAGTLAEGRVFGHTASLLSDGRVLVVGGWTGGGERLSSAEIWDPATATFEVTGQLAAGLVDHTATLLSDGRVLVIGDHDDNGEGDPGLVRSSAEIWDPTTGSFGPAVSLGESFYPHTATLLSDGRVLVLSSRRDVGTSGEIWDPVTESSRPTGSPAGFHDHSTATLLLDGRVLVIGGLGSEGSAEIWDPVTETFQPAGSLPELRASHTATLLSDGRVLVVGGGRHWDDPSTWLATAEIWDPVTEAFGPTGPLATEHGSHTATALPDGRVLVIGGNDNRQRAIAMAEVWEPSDG
jgi:hypothetical protein